METELLTSQLTAGFGVAALIQWLKGKSWFPFASADNAQLNRATSFIFALITAVGIHYSFDPDLGTLTITGLTLSNLLHTGWATLQQYAVQQVSYKKLIKGGSQ